MRRVIRDSGMQDAGYRIQDAGYRIQEQWCVGFGLVDLLYGICSHDRVSRVVGPAIIAISVYIAWSKNKR
jgi:hypothetical protein